MGLFSDPCPNPDCGARVKKAAHFCSRCGWAGPNSLSNCPGCGKRVGRVSRFCWNCGADMEREKPPRIMGDRWVREDEELAVRVNPGDVEGFRARRVTVEPGTIGLVERQGRIAEEKEWGVHTLDQILSLRKASSIILVSAGDLVLRPTFRGLRDANGAELDVTVQVVLRVKDYDAFVRHFFEGHKRRVTYATLETTIGNELHDVTRGLVCAHSMEEMYGNLTWRNELEADLRSAMTVTLDRYGLDLLQLNFVDFGGDHFEQLQQDKGEAYMGNHAADHLGEKVAIRRRIAELNAQGKLDAVATDKDLADKIDDLNTQYDVKSVLRDSERVETVAQARHELVIKNELREYELEDLGDERTKQKQDEQLARKQTLDKIQVDHQNEVAMTILVARNKRDATQADFDREQERLSAENTLKVEWQQSEQKRQTRRADAVQEYELIVERARSNTAARLEALKVTREEEAIKHADREHQVAMLERVERQEVENLQTIKRLELEEKKLELDLKRFEKEKEAEVQLATIEGNVKIATSEATTAAAVSQAEKRQLEERLADQKAEKEALRGDADRRARDLKDIAEVVTKGGGQSAVVVAGQGGVQQVGGADAGESPCPKCGRPVPHSANFCPWCKHDMKG